MIKKSTELDFKNKKFAVIIAGVPGIGKTTLALSAPKPLLIDLDNGISRVEAKYRTDTDVVSNYEELMQDLQVADLAPYETIVIDTGGKLLDMLKPVVIKEDAKNGKRDGNLSLQGYGAVKRKFNEFIKFVKTLNKHLVIVFHATETNLANDVVGLRIRMEGSSKDEVWDDIDVGGFVEMNGKKRTIGFSNCERYYAKGTHGIQGIYELPTLENGSANTFLTDMFKMITDNLNKEVGDTALYQEVINQLKPLIEQSIDANSFNVAYKSIKNANHYLTSKEELNFFLKGKCKELGLKYDKATDKFTK